MLIIMPTTNALAYFESKTALNLPLHHVMQSPTHLIEIFNVKYRHHRFRNYYPG